MGWREAHRALCPAALLETDRCQREGQSLPSVLYESLQFRIQCLWPQIDLVKVSGLQNNGMNVEWGPAGRRVADVIGGS